MVKSSEIGVEGKTVQPNWSVTQKAEVGSWVTVTAGGSWIVNPDGNLPAGYIQAK